LRKEWICGILALILLFGVLSGVPFDVKAVEQMTISDELIEVVKKMEGFYAFPYWDYAQWTIGYGTRCPDDKLEEYKKTGITEEIAIELLHKELASFEKTVNNFIIKYNLDLKQHQFDALVSFSYNCGGAWTRRLDSFFNIAVRTGMTGSDFLYAMTLHSTAGGDYILVKRRLCEANMYLNGVYKAYNKDKDAVPSNYKYVYLDGNGATCTYTIHAYDTKDPVAPMFHFESIPTGVDAEGNGFIYEFGGWYTADGVLVEVLDGSLANGTVLYAQWKEPGGDVVQFHKGDVLEPLTITTTTSSIKVRSGPGTFYPTVGTLDKGEMVTVTETFLRSKTLWGKIETGWISLSYTDYEEALLKREEEKENNLLPRPGEVTGQGVNVRSGPGTNYEVQYQKFKGDPVVIYEIVENGSLTWGRLEDGNWICLTYVAWVEEPVDPSEPSDPSEPAEKPIPVITGVTLVQGPKKTEYVQMQELIDPNCAVLRVDYSDGTCKALSLGQEMIQEYNNEVLGETTVLAIYEGFEVYFNVTIIKATVTFLNYDGTVLSAQQYAYGEEVIPPEDPTKPAEGDTKYVFVGWHEELKPCHGNATYIAVYEVYVEKYPVTFLNYDGSVISTAEYAMGETVIVPENPTRPSDELGEYVFVGWDKEVTACEGETVYTAVYELHVWKYMVTFLNYDGSVISATEYAMGETVAIPENPTRPSDVYGDYTFIGWDKEVTVCAGEATYTAQYSLAWKEYTVTFQNDDGTIISSATYTYGQTVEVPEVIPEKPADLYGSYTFAGWDQEVTICEGDTVYTAKYDLDPIMYTVIFLDEDGTVIATQQYGYQQTIQPPQMPNKPADEYAQYVFIGWDQEVTVCQGNMTFTARYEAKPILYTIIFRNYDGSIVSEKQYTFGQEIEIPENPTRPSDVYGSYTFHSWDPMPQNCAGNAEYVAVYQLIPKLYTVTFVDYDGTVLSSEQYTYDQTVNVPEAPHREADAYGAYIFVGWDKEVTSCKGDTVYTAQYDLEYTMYTVKFLNYNGKTIQSGEYTYGQEITVPSDPSRATDEYGEYEFVGWHKDITACDGIIVGFPIYFSGIAGQGKVFLDRLYPMMDAAFIPRHPGKKVLAVYAQGDSNEKAFLPAIRAADYVFRMCGWKQVDSILCAGTSSPGFAIPEELLERVKAAAEKL